MSSDGKQVTYEIGADAGNFTAGMERAAQASTQAASKIKAQFDQVGNAFSTVQKQLLMITAVVGGGAFFKEAIAAANKMTGESMSLSKRLGITGDAAAALNTALGDIGSDSETYIGAFDKFAKQVKTNEVGLNEMGIQTRDTNGHLRDSQTLFQEALATVGQYKPGLDQTTAAMTLFGKGVDDAMKLQRLNNGLIDEAKKKNEELGLTLTVEGVAATKAYKAAMNDVGDVMTAVQVTIGQAVMPVFTELAQYFATSGPYVVGVFKGALTALMLVFRTLQLVVKSVFTVIFEVISGTVDQFGSAAEAIGRFLSGDFKGAEAMWETMKQRTKQGFSNVLSGVREAYAETIEASSADLTKMWAKGTSVSAPKGGSKTMGEFKTDGADKDKKDPSFMKYYDEALVEEKRLATERDAIHGMSKQQELDFWNNLLQFARLTSADQVAVQRKASEARIEVLKKEAEDANELGKLGLAAWEARSLARVAADEETARNAQALGSTTQEQLLQQELQFEQRRNAIKLAALNANLTALDPTRDPVAIAQVNNQIEALEAEHQQRLAIIRGQLAVASATEQRKIWEDLGSRMSSLWDQGINAMMQGTLTWAGAMRAVGTQIVGWFANSVVKPKVTAWLLGESAKTGATATGTGMRMAMEGLAAAKSVAIWAMTAVKNIMANAWTAMSAAWAAVSGIPVIGPALAVVAAGATFAGVAAIAGRVMSAEGGYDIPSGVNPMTQLHEKEMVLPAKHADVIRGMADGGAGSAGGNTAVTIQAHPMPGNYFIVHRDQLVAAIKSAKRDFAL